MNRTWDPDRRRAALHALADALIGAGDRILPVAAAETGLAEARLTAELERTTGQLRLLADRIATAGAAVVAPPPRPAAPTSCWSGCPIGRAGRGVRRVELPPRVRGRSAATPPPRSPPAAPSSSRPTRPSRAPPTCSPRIAAAVLPDGVFRLVHGGADASLALVCDPAIRAVAFTGSPSGGRALMDAAAARPDPIPVSRRWAR